MGSMARAVLCLGSIVIALNTSGFDSGGAECGSLSLTLNGETQVTEAECLG